MIIWFQFLIVFSENWVKITSYLGTCSIWWTEDPVLTGDGFQTTVVNRIRIPDVIWEKILVERKISEFYGPIDLEDARILARKDRLTWAVQFRIGLEDIEPVPETYVLYTLGAVIVTFRKLLDTFGNLFVTMELHRYTEGLRINDDYVSFLTWMALTIFDHFDIYLVILG